MNFEARAYASLTLATLKMYFRNPVASAAMSLVVIAILGVLKLIGLATAQPVPRTSIDIVNHSRAAEAVALVSALKRVDSFDVTIASESEASRALSDRKSDIKVIIPAAFGNRDVDGRLEPVSLTTTFRAG